MRRILLVKTSSLGDVVHNLPVVTDLRAQFPDVEIDWAVERSLSAIPKMHPAVSQVVPVEPRRWRRSLASRATWDEIGQIRDQFRTRGYDAVIDTQGLVKSALIARLAPGRRYGLDWRSSREPLRPLYNQTFAVPWTSHAVERNRSLAAQALQYGIDTPADYGLAVGQAADTQSDLYAVLLHSTSAMEKLWPERQWVKLGDYLRHNGLRSVLIWGSDEERERSERIAKLIKDAQVAPRLTLTDAAELLRKSAAVFGVDSGLSHLAVALGTPTVGIYCATDPAATGLYGGIRIANVGSKGGPPSVSQVIAAWRELA